ncbi:MAG: DUF1801 domain-containing protein [Phycisphaerales bacterium JB039]
MPTKPTTVKQYLDALPPDRRAAIEAIRKVILDNLDPACEERIQYGMIGYCVPHSVYPAGYHCDPAQPLPFASIASQKGHMALYLCNIYMDPAEAEWFRAAWTKGGRKLDMGKSCVRFKKLEDVPLDVVGKVIKRTSARKLIKLYEANLPATARKRAAAAPASKTAPKKTTAKKVAKKAPANTTRVKKAAKKTASGKAPKKASRRS